LLIVVLPPFTQLKYIMFFMLIASDSLNHPHIDGEQTSVLICKPSIVFRISPSIDDILNI